MKRALRFAVRCAAVVCSLTGVSTAASAQTSPTPLRTDFLVGTVVRPISMDGKDYVLADLPVMETIFRVPNKPISFSTVTGLTWGIKGGFTLEGAFGGSLRWEPARFVTLFAQGRFGTFFFNHYSLLGNAGVEFNIPVGAQKDLVLGVEYFGRHAGKWAGFMKQQKWYVSGDGVALRLGFRIRRITRSR